MGFFAKYKHDRLNYLSDYGKLTNVKADVFKEKIMKVAILGSGDYGSAMTVPLSLNGINSTIYARSEKSKIECEKKRYKFKHGYCDY